MKISGVLTGKALNIVYILFTQIVFSQPVFSSESMWLLFSEPAGTNERICMGTITLNVSNQFKAPQESIDSSSTQKRYRSVSRGSRFHMMFSSGLCLDYRFPKIDGMPVYNVKRKYTYGNVCKSVCSFEKHALKNLNYEDAEATVFYKQKNHEWLIKGEEKLINVGLSDDTKGRGLPFFLDAIIIEQKNFNKHSRPTSVSDDQFLLFKLFEEIWGKNYFDPLLGTDCLWTINLFLGRQFCVQMIDENGNSYWLVFYNTDDTSSGYSAYQEKERNNFLRNWVNLNQCWFNITPPIKNLPSMFGERVSCEAGKAEFIQLDYSQNIEIKGGI